MSATGLISCIRENSPPMDMAPSEAGAFSQSSSSCTDSQKPRRFHPLRNFRRIFRRQTMSGTHTFGRTVTSTSSAFLPEPSQTSYTASQLIPSPTCKFVSTLNPNDFFHGDDITLSNVDFGRISSKNEHQPLHPTNLKVIRGNGVDPAASMNVEVPQSVLGGPYAAISSGHESTTATPSNVKNVKGPDMNSEPCLSESRLMGRDCSGDIILQSENTVSAAVTVSSLSHGVKFELFDIARKCIPDDSGLSRTSQMKLQPVIQKEMSSAILLNMTTSTINNDSTSVDISNRGNADEAINSSFSYNVKDRVSFSEMSMNLNEIDVKVPSGFKLSHAAAHHKMAVRPKKKEPMRHRRAKEQFIQTSTPEATDHIQEDSADYGVILIDKSKKSKLLPPHINEKLFQQDCSVISNVSPSSVMECNEKEIISVSSVLSNIPRETGHICSDQTGKIECKDEFGDFKCFLHRNSKRINWLDNYSDHNAVTDISGLVNHETQTVNNEINPIPSEITRKELISAVDLKPSTSFFSPTSPLPFDNNGFEGKFAKKVAKLKSGAASRQRVQPKDLSLQTPPSETYTAGFLLDDDGHVSRCFKDNVHSPQVGLQTVDNYPLEKQEINSELLLNEETKIPTLNGSSECFNKYKLNNYSLNPSKQIVYQMESSATHSMKPTSKQRKSVEKSKSFRRSDEPVNHERHFKKLENMQSLPDLSSYSHSMVTIMESATNNKREFITLPSRCCEIYEYSLENTIKNKETLVPTIDSRVSTKKSSPRSCVKNLAEIEEKIDNLVKSSYVSVLKSGDYRKKVSAVVPTKVIHENKLFATEECTETKPTPLNFCDTAQSKSSEILIEAEGNLEKHRERNLEKRDSYRQEQIKLPLLSTKIKNLKSTSTIPHDTSILLDPKILIEEAKMPEFMKIQLNRVDTPRHKTNLIFSKNVKTNVSEAERDLVRRFSNEYVEIKTNSQLPVIASKAPSKRNRRNESIVEDVLKNSQLEESSANKQSLNVDSKNNILNNNENTVTAITGIPLKEGNQKLPNKSQDSNAEKKESIQEPNLEIIEKETATFLRKKFVAPKKRLPDNKEDTPELMKVFARRSLIVQDTEDLQTTLKQLGNVDSNKENQNNETTNVFPKNEIKCQPKPILPKNKVGVKSDNLSEKSKTDLLIQTRIPKPFVQSLRFSAPSCYESMSTDLADTKRTTTSQIPSMTLNATCNRPKQLQSTVESAINPENTRIMPNEDTDQFKGILQRRAEWEQRAKEVSN